MMKNIIKRKFINIIISNRILLLFNLVIFSFTAGLDIKPVLEIGGGASNYIIISLINHYYVLYGMLPIISVIIAKYIKNIRSEEKLRYRNRQSQIFVDISSFGAWLFCYFLLHLVILFVVGLTVFGSWREVALTRVEAYNEIFMLLETYMSVFGSPSLAILSIIGYYCFGFIVYFSLFSVLNYKIGYKNTIKLYVLIFLLTFIGFKTNLSFSIPVIFFNNYILLHHGLFVNGTFSFIVTIVLGLLIIAYSVGIKVTLQKMTLIDELTVPRKIKRLVALIFLAILCLEWLRLFYQNQYDPLDVIISLLAGSYLKFSFVEWAKTSLIYLMPIFFISISFSKIRHYAEMPIFVRYKSKRFLSWKLLTKYTRFVFSYVCLVFMCCLLLFIFRGNSSSYNNALADIFGVNFGVKVFLSYMVLFTVNTFFCLVLFFILNKFIKETASFIIMVILFLLNVLISDTNIMKINLGILSYLNSVKQNSGSFKISLLIMIMFVLLYYFFMWRNGKNENHRIKPSVKKIQN